MLRHSCSIQLQFLKGVADMRQILRLVLPFLFMGGLQIQEGRWNRSGGGRPSHLRICPFQVDDVVRSET